MKKRVEFLITPLIQGARPTGVQQEEKMLPREVAPDDSEIDPTKRKYAKEEEQEKMISPNIPQPKTEEK